MKAKEISRAALYTVLALGLSYLESLIPFYFGIPGMKIGLPNLVLFFVLYRESVPKAFSVSLLRIALSALLFGNVYSLLYSFTGGVLSLFLMALLKKTPLSKITVSIFGAVTHNIGKIIVAVLMLHSWGIVMYFPALLLSSILAGTLIGILSGILIVKIPKFIKD